MGKLITIPEFVLHKYISIGIEFVRADYKMQQDKSNSYLMRVLSMAGFERYDFSEQALAVFLKDTDDPRFLEVHLMWNMVKENMPSIHVTLPAENQQSGGNGMGMDEGYMDELYVDSTYDDGGDVQTAGSSTPVYTRRYQATYNIVTVSDNSTEVILIYHVLKALLTSLQPSLSLEGLQNITVGGNDLSLKGDMVPKNLHMRSIAVNLQYECSAPSIYSNKLFKSLLVSGIAVIAS